MVQINKEQCIGCGLCVIDCVSGILQIRDRKAGVLPYGCILCGHCIAVCPRGAVSVTEYGMDDVEEASPPLAGADRLLTDMKNRRSVRHFLTKTVEEEKLEKIVQAIRYCPTGSNRQKVDVTIVKQYNTILTEKMLQALCELADDPPETEEKKLILQYAPVWRNMREAWKTKGQDGLFYRAPVVLLLSGWRDIDTALAASYAELMIYELGLGCVYVGFARMAARKEQVREYLRLKPDYDLTCALALGYPDPVVRYRRTVPRKQKNFTMM